MWAKMDKDGHESVPRSDPSSKIFDLSSVRSLLHNGDCGHIGIGLIIHN